MGPAFLLAVCLSQVTTTSCQTTRAVYPPQQVQAVAVYPTQQWVHEFQQGPFRFHSQFPLKPAPLQRDLAQIQQELEQQLGLKIGKRPIEVQFYDNWETYRRATQAHVRKGLIRRALFVKGPKKSYVYAYRHNGFDIDVRHERTHALIHNAVQFIPLWMDEGLAEYFENKVGNGRLRPAALRSAKNTYFWRQQIVLEDLERLDGISQMGDTQYRHSWAWIHFLMDDVTNSNETRKVLFDYLAEIRKGNPPGDFSVFLNRRLPNSRGRIAHHFRTYR